MEGVGALVPAVERAEGETDLIDRARRDREIITLFPGGTVFQKNGPTERSGHASDHLATDEGAPDAFRQRLCSHERGWLAAAVVLREVAIDDPGAEEKAVVVARWGAATPPMRMTRRSTFASGLVAR